MKITHTAVQRTYMFPKLTCTEILFPRCFNLQPEIIRNSFSTDISSYAFRIVALKMCTFYVFLALNLQITSAYLCTSWTSRAKGPAPMNCQRIQNTARHLGYSVRFGKYLFDLESICSIWTVSVRFGKYLFDLDGICSIWKVSLRFNLFNLECICSIWTVSVRFGKYLFDLTCSIWNVSDRFRLWRLKIVA